MQSGLYGRLPTDAYISIARARIKEPAKRARLAIDNFRSRPSSSTLQEAVIFASELIKHVTEIAKDNLQIAYQTDALLMTIDLVHKIVDMAKVTSVAESLGKDNVITALDRFSLLIDKLIADLNSVNVVPYWVHESSLENLRDAFPVQSCQIRARLSHDEKMAHYFIFLLKGDLLRYKCNLLHEPYNGVSKAYWSSYCFSPEHGNLLNLLAIVALNRDKTDTLGAVFYFCRALSAEIPFESCTETLRASLGAVTERMLASDFAKYYKFFDDPSLYDLNGLLATKIDATQKVYFFTPEVGIRNFDPMWKRGISRLSKPTVRNMTFDCFLHLMNMIIHRQSHEITWPCANMFICFLQHCLDEDIVTGRELVQVVTIFFFALSKRCKDGDGVLDDTLKVALQTFSTVIGLLLAKCYEFMLTIGDDGFDVAEKKVDVVLPALVVVVAHWVNLADSLPHELAPILSHYFSFSLIRTKLMRLGSTLHDYLGVFHIQIQSLPFETREEGAVVFPELLYATLSNRLTTEVSAVKLLNGADETDSLTFKTFLMRISLVANLLVYLTEKKFFGLDSNFSPTSIPDMSTFELYHATTSNPIYTQYAVYPEFIVIDTNTVIDEYLKIGEIVQSNIGKFKIVITPVVISELMYISRNEFRKSEQVRLAAAGALSMITQLIEKGCPRLQIYNYYGERKFDFNFTPRDLCGLGAEVDPSRKKDKNDDHIAKTCVKLEELVREPESDFQAASIVKKKSVLVTDDKILRINARTINVVVCAFDDFYKWFQYCQGKER
uniref:PIN domain-containing protein n=1 Tax=Panagrolaimus sp. JU765 TaxID=591449 RepID=A0AC34QYM7_9BILA